MWAVNDGANRAHQMQITNAWVGEDGVTQLWIRDPNTPSRLDTVTVGDDNTVDDNITWHFFMVPGVRINQIHLEVRD